MRANVWRDFRSFAALTLFVLVFHVRPCTATIRYQIRLDDPQKHIFAVEMTIPKAPSGTRIALPAWNALYQIRDFAYRVRDVHAGASSASDLAARELFVTKIDKQTWQLGVPADGAEKSPADDIVIHYTIEWDDPGPFDSQLNSHHAFLNLAEVLMYVPDRR